MDIATILFTYNRSRHTEEVLEALEKNTVLPEKLYIYQDGLKCEEHREEWKKVNELIRKVDFCPVEVFISETNRGLAKSIVSGINDVFEKHDAVIVLEDDCVPTSNFIRFMQMCFEKYEDDKRIYSVSGYAWPINLSKDEKDVYGCGRISSWGWGTWKDRWQKYEKDYEFVKKMKQKEETSRALALWGADLEATLVGNIRGECDSWAVFWALTVIWNQGICINPYRSLIANIGMDGSGVHCGVSDRFEIETEDEDKEEFSLSDRIEISDKVKRAFVSLYGSYTALDNKAVEDKEKILVYGQGNYFRESERELNLRYHIVAFVDSYKKGYYAGKKIIRPEDIKDYSFDKILIVIKNIGECIKITKRLINELGILSDVIKIENFTEFDKLQVAADGDLIVAYEGTEIKISSLDEYNNVWEVFVNKNYCYDICSAEIGGADVVIDIGMNIGDSVLYFAQNPKIEKIYAFEPFQETFMRAEENVKRNNITRERICLFSYGLSDRTETRYINYNGEMSCGQSSLLDVREKAFDNYRNMGLAGADGEREEMIEVKKASDIISKITEEHTGANIVLKMDCEGEEYGIIENLSEENLLEKIDFIMMEWHYKGNENLLLRLKEHGFSYWCSDKGKNMGLIYAYHVKN